MKSRLAPILPLLLGACLVFVLVSETMAATYNAPSGNTRVTFGPNDIPPINQLDEFKSGPMPLGLERVWFYVQVCCVQCTCPPGQTCGVEFFGTVSVTGSSGTSNLAIPTQKKCASCMTIKVEVQGSSWGPPATSVSCAITAKCICCEDGKTVSVGDPDVYSAVDLEPTTPNPDPYP